MIKTEIVKVTPAMAQEWLGAAAHNRSLSRRTVEAYALDMRNGKWSLTHQGVGFDEGGQLIDGQHRLHAVIESGCTVAMMVARGIDARSADAIDGGRPRTVADRLRLHEIDNGQQIAARCTIIQWLDDGRPRTTVRGTLAQTLATRVRYSDALAWSFRALPQKGVGMSSPTTGVLTWCYDRRPEEIDVFARQVRTGEGLFRGDPALALRRFCSQHSSSGNGGRIAMSEATLRCAAAAVDGEKLHYVYTGADAAKALDAAEALFRRAKR